MRWHLKANKKVGKGDNDQTFREWVESLEADGIDTTGMLDDEPDLFSDLIEYWQAFHILSSSRSTGFGVSSIPLPAYESYFNIMGVDSLEERFNYIKFVGVLDNEFMRWQGEKNEAEKKKNKSSKHQALPPKR